MQEERKQLEKLFQKYQQGLVTEEEKALIASWLTQLDVSGPFTSELLENRQNLSKEQLQNRLFPKAHDAVKTTRIPFWIRTVAAGLFVISATAVFFYFNNKDHHSLNKVTYQEVSTKIGEMKLITLLDGTKITLNNESKIKYATVFNEKTREVFLSGQAFFEVTHNPAKPFKVHTDKVDVQVLGTSFDIEAYKQDKELHVSVATGKIAVSNHTSKELTPYVLRPGDAFTYNRATGKISRSGMAVADINAWQNGKFIFRDEMLENITRKLSRYYKVSFQFKNKSLLAKQINLRVKNQQINTLMKALSISAEFHYKIEGNIITIW